MITTRSQIFPNHVSCICSLIYHRSLEDSCVCTNDERVLRLYIENNGEVPAMTPEQRAVCIDDIVHCDEGEKAESWVGATDADLAGGVLHAWAAFARDKGVI